MIIGRILMSIVAVFVMVTEFKGLTNITNYIINPFKRFEQKTLSTLILIFMSYFIIQPKGSQELENYILLLGLFLSLYYLLSSFKKISLEDFEKIRDSYNNITGEDSDLTAKKIAIGSKVFKLTYALIMFTCTCLISWN